MRTGVNLAIFVFVIVAILHLMRLVDEVNIVIDGWIVPQWASIIGVIVPVTIAWMLWKDR
jgi:hypothetical protein